MGYIGALILALAAALTGGIEEIPACSGALPTTATQRATQAELQRRSSTLSSVNVPAYAGDPWCAVDADATHPQGMPDFSAEEIQEARSGSYLSFSELDSQRRCGTAQACLGPDTLATKKRGSIRSVYPTGGPSVPFG